jgi:hypothetical protein
VSEIRGNVEKIVLFFTSNSRNKTISLSLSLARDAHLPSLNSHNNFAALAQQAQISPLHFLTRALHFLHNLAGVSALNAVVAAGEKCIARKWNAFISQRTPASRREKTRLSACARAQVHQQHFRDPARSARIIAFDRLYIHTACIDKQMPECNWVSISYGMPPVGCSTIIDPLQLFNSIEKYCNGDNVITIT